MSLKLDSGKSEVYSNISYYYIWGDELFYSESVNDLSKKVMEYIEQKYLSQCSEDKLLSEVIKDVQEEFSTYFIRYEIVDGTEEEKTTSSSDLKILYTAQFYFYFNYDVITMDKVKYNYQLNVSHEDLTNGISITAIGIDKKEMPNLGGTLGPFSVETDSSYYDGFYLNITEIRSLRAEPFVGYQTYGGHYQPTGLIEVEEFLNSEDIIERVTHDDGALANYYYVQNSPSISNDICLYGFKHQFGGWLVGEDDNWFYKNTTYLPDVAYGITQDNLYEIETIGKYKNSKNMVLKDILSVNNSNDKIYEYTEYTNDAGTETTVYFFYNPYITNGELWPIQIPSAIGMNEYHSILSPVNWLSTNGTYRQFSTLKQLYLPLNESLSKYNWLMKITKISSWGFMVDTESSSYSESGREQFDSFLENYRLYQTQTYSTGQPREYLPSKTIVLYVVPSASGFTRYQAVAEISDWDNSNDDISKWSITYKIKSKTSNWDDRPNMDNYILKGSFPNSIPDTDISSWEEDRDFDKHVINGLSGPSIDDL